MKNHEWLNIFHWYFQDFSLWLFPTTLAGRKLFKWQRWARSPGRLPWSPTPTVSVSSLLTPSAHVRAVLACNILIKMWTASFDCFLFLPHGTVNKEKSWQQKISNLYVYNYCFYSGWSIIIVLYNFSHYFQLHYFYKAVYRWTFCFLYYYLSCRSVSYYWECVLRLSETSMSL